jgi:hypothetical protein
MKEKVTQVCEPSAESLRKIPEVRDWSNQRAAFRRIREMGTES